MTGHTNWQDIRAASNLLSRDQIERIASVIDDAKVNGDRDTDEYVDEIVGIIAPRRNDGLRVINEDGPGPTIVMPE